MFDNEMRRVNTCIPMDSKVVKRKKETKESSKQTEDELKSDKSKKAESSEEKAKESRKKMLGKKRAGKEQQQESSNRQRMEDDKEIDEHEEVEVDDEAEMKKHLVIVKDDDIAIAVIPLATKPPVIVEYKLLKEGIMIQSELFKSSFDSMWRALVVKIKWKRCAYQTTQAYGKAAKGSIKGEELLGLKRLQGFLELLLLSAAGTKTLCCWIITARKTYYCQEDKDGLNR
ncbi:hypothetical protein Tco_0990144 [Tanacetum coccineum]|uniref:Uncharacterized protein n=1 Tax=Tanacetum coccineum TaxID=301880 RepID=A0ABQ5EVV6_9ASTR